MLANNKLAQLPPEMSQLNLRALDLANNKLTKRPDGL